MTGESHQDADYCCVRKTHLVEMQMHAASVIQLPLLLHHCCSGYRRHESREGLASGCITFISFENCVIICGSIEDCKPGMNIDSSVTTE